MATKIITSDEQLRKYIPNLFATAQGETPFFDRLLPWLQTAERWLFSQFVGDDYADTFLSLDENEPVRLTAAAVVVHEAFMRAVPSLDLVLTPNGFGIVSNQNVAPASRDHVAWLIALLEELAALRVERIEIGEPRWLEQFLPQTPRRLGNNVYLCHVYNIRTLWT